jgi:hypothetical protein
MLSLALNLVLTGAFILLMKWLVARDRTPASADLVPGTHSRHQESSCWEMHVDERESSHPHLPGDTRGLCRQLLCAIAPDGPPTTISVDG